MAELNTPDPGLEQNQDPSSPPNLTPPPDNSAAPTTITNNTSVSSPVPQAVPMSAGQYAQAGVDRAEQAKQAQADIATAKSEQAKRDVTTQDPLIASAAQAATDAKHWQDQYATQHEAAFGTNGTLTKSLQQLNQQKVDPDHWWNSKDTGGKIEAVIGLMLGGIGQGLAAFGKHGINTGNMALEEMDKVIKNDIDSQPANLDNKWKVYQSQSGIADNQDNFNKFKILDSQIQYVAAQRVALEKLKQSAAMAADPVAKANGQLAIVDLQKQIDDEQRAWGQHNEGLAATAASATRAFQQHLLERQEHAQDVQVTQGNALELEKAKADATAFQNEQARAQKAGEDLQKEHEVKSQDIARRRRDVLDNRLKNPTGIIHPFNTFGDNDAASLASLDAEQKDVDSQYAYGKAKLPAMPINVSAETPPAAGSKPPSGADLPDVSGKK